MELFSTSENEYLLEASIESMHAECVVWSSLLNFWNDEIMFFINILEYKNDSKAELIDNLAKVEKELIRLHSEGLAKTQAEVSAHARLLAVCENSSADKSKICNTHGVLVNDMVTLHTEIRHLRKRVFEWIAN